jgi:hypothetical protein
MKKPIGEKRISRKKPEEKRKNYFTMDTQDAIVRFQKEIDIEKRNEIYKNEIHPAFESLAENLINVYKFQSEHESKSDLKHSAVENLFTIINKYDVTKNSKAFSYFNVVAKHWLIVRSKMNAKSLQSFQSIDDKDSFSSHEKDIIDYYNYLPSCDEIVTDEDIKNTVKLLLTSVKNEARTINEVMCADAMLLLFDQSEMLDMINKRSAMAYLRELTGLTNKQLSTVVSSLKKIYKELRKTIVIESKHD